MKNYKLEFVSLNQPVLIGRFMLIFSRRKIDVTDFSYSKINDEDGKFVIEFNTDENQAKNLLKLILKQIDVFSGELLEI